MSLREALVMMLAAAIGAAATAWFLATHERVTENVWTGFRGEARQNPWLAAERFLNRVAVPTDELRTLPDLRTLPPAGTLIVPDAHQSISARLRDALVAWVRNGGHLIVEAEPAQQDDPLLEAFGVRRSAVEPKRRNPAIDHSGERKFDQVRLPNATAPALVDVHAAVSLEADGAWFRAEGRYGTWLVTIRFGNGIVTALGDLDYLSNGAIGSLDHAQFLWDLVRLREPATSADTDIQPVRFFNHPGKLSLMDWLANNAWAPLIGATAALLLWLWHVIPRFGPVLPDPERTRRSLLDHLRASGRFLWSNGHTKRLLESSRRACLRRINRSLPHFPSASPGERVSLLMQALGLEEEQARRILEPQEGGNMPQFLQTIRVYQQVNARLAERRSAPAAGRG